MKPVLLPDGRELYVYPDGGMFTQIRLGRGVLLQGAYCHSPTPMMVGDVIAGCERVLREEGRIVAMVDARHAHTMNAEFRDAVTHWFMQHKHAARTHMLQNSRLMVAALSFINLLARHTVITAHSNVDEFERRIIKELGSFDRRLLDSPPSQRISISA